MYKIGEFSILARTTIRTLRYYEKEGLLIPSFIDNNGYRYYETSKLHELIKIISLRQLDFSIKEIKAIFAKSKELVNSLEAKKKTIEKEIIENNFKLTKINNLLEGKNMNYEVIEKELPDYEVYYKESIVKDFSEIPSFILLSAQECRQLNPNIKCIEPDYCYVSYLDGEYKENNVKIRYAQAVKEKGIFDENIHFEKLKPVNAICIYHKGSFDKIREAYNFVMKYINDNGYKIIDSPRERYIDGMWNKDSEDEWLTEIQIPVQK